MTPLPCSSESQATAHLTHRKAVCLPAIASQRTGHAVTAAPPAFLIMMVACANIPGSPVNRLFGQQPSAFSDDMPSIAAHRNLPLSRAPHIARTLKLIKEIAILLDMRRKPQRMLSNLGCSQIRISRLQS